MSPKGCDANVGARMRPHFFVPHNGAMHPIQTPSTPDAPATASQLRVLTLNIQVGMPTQQFSQYLTGAWRHLLPSPSARRNLDRIAEFLQDFDLVALQEADAGSLRTAQINQIEYLARRAGFNHWYAAVNRNLGPFAQHALGFISRYPLNDVQHHVLPGAIKGRGVLRAQLQLDGYAPLDLLVSHLALGRKTRTRQFSHLASLVSAQTDTLLMGDLNCAPEELHAHPQLQKLGFRCVQTAPTYPSWKPRRSIDHVLATPGAQVDGGHVLDLSLSDHLPVAAEVTLRRL